MRADVLDELSRRETVTFGNNMLPIPEKYYLAYNDGGMGSALKEEV